MSACRQAALSEERANFYNGSDSDGIKELNNPAPNWIIFVFLLTYGFSLFYAIHYFGYPENGNDQVTEYKNKIGDKKPFICFRNCPFPN